MPTVINQTFGHSLSGKSADTGVFSKFIHWCERQEENRLLWTGLGLGLHGCAITPLAFLAVVMSGANFALLLITMLAMVAVLIVNLAALPTKITIPVFLTTILVDVMIVAACVFSGFHIP